MPRQRTSNVDRSNERKRFYTKKARSRWCPVEIITDVDYADDRALLANTPTEPLLHSLEQAAGGIGYVNADKTEYMCFNQKGDISTLNGGFLKLVDNFTYLRSSVSSTENDIKTCLVKAWTAIDSLSIMWKFDLSDEINRNFFQVCRFYNMDAPYGRWLCV